METARSPGNVIGVQSDLFFNLICYDVFLTFYLAPSESLKLFSVDYSIPTALSRDPSGVPGVKFQMTYLHAELKNLEFSKGRCSMPNAHTESMASLPLSSYRTACDLRMSLCHESNGILFFTML